MYKYEVIREIDGEIQSATLNGNDISEAVSAMVFIGWSAESIISVKKIEDEIEG